MKRFVLDTSALVKAYVEEEGTPQVRALFENAPAGSLLVCRVGHPRPHPRSRDASARGVFLSRTPPGCSTTSITI